MPAAPLPAALPSSPAAQYYARGREAFFRAADAAGLQTHCFLAGSLYLRLHLAGQALKEKLTRAMRHIEIPAAPMGAEVLDVYCFDSASTGVPMPPPPWPPTAYGQKGHILGYNDGAMHCVYQPGVDILHLYNRTENAALYWVDAAETIPYWEASFPMRGLVHWWSLATPWQLMHAGAVGFADGGVLLAGKSGSGKSTTALSCLGTELSYASDDYVLVRTGPAPYVASMYSTAKLVPDNLHRLPALEEKIVNAGALGSEKALFFLAEHFRSGISTGFPVRALFLPRVTGGPDTSLTPATPAEALFALAPTTVLHLEGGSREAFAKMSTLSKTVPVFWLNLGTELPQIPATIARYLRTGAA